jgi:hypothetical protein
LRWEDLVENAEELDKMQKSVARIESRNSADSVPCWNLEL